MVESLPSKQVVASSSLVFRFLYIKNERKESLTRICKQTSLQHLRFTCSICYRKLPAPAFYEIKDFLNVVRASSSAFYFIFCVLRRHGQVVRQEPAKLSSPVRIWVPPFVFCLLFFRSIKNWGKFLEYQTILSQL